MFLRTLTTWQIIALIAFLESGFVIGALAMALGSRGTDAPTKKTRWLKFFSYAVIVHVSVAAFGSGGIVAAGFSLAIAFIGMIEIVRAQLRRGFRGHHGCIAAGAILFFILLAGSMLAVIRSCTAVEVLYVYLVIAVLDSYSQLTGQIFGKHRLAPRISPNKTVEGVIGGAGAAMFTAVFFRAFIGEGIGSALLTGVLLTLAGVAGDLSASAFKRYNGIKDYGSILPGQGGVIDRYNSFIAASAVYMIMKLTVV
jgi:phosphatidate cytidylyltransferase